MKISEQFITSLLARIDLVELINKKINLRQVGTNLVGLCPFHQEKTPSFTVNKSKQFFHCFGCKEHGDAIRFVMLTENKNFLLTVQDLANRYGMSLEKEAIVLENPLITEIHKVLTIAVDYYHNNLLQNNSFAVAALDYLITRKIDLATIRHFKLGLASAAWTGLIDFFNTDQIKNQLNPKFEILQLLQQAGLIIEKNNKFYDRFRGRIIFPIRDKFSKPIGFGARSLSDQQTPKYLNSPETLVFSKSKELYGLSEIKSTLKSFNNIIVVEGYVDLLSLFQAKIFNVVATLGTAFNENHIKTLLNITPELIFCFDGDLAGYKASIRSMEIILRMLNSKNISTKHIIKFAILPNGYDPDLLIREKGAVEFNKILLEAKLLSDFFFDHLIKKYPDPSIENLNKLALDAKEYINKLPDQILQNLWYEKLAKILGIDSSILKISQNSVESSKNQIKYKKASDKYNITVNGNRTFPSSAAIKALAMLLLDLKLFEKCDELKKLDLTQLINVTLPSDLELLFKVINLLTNNFNEYIQYISNSADIIFRLSKDLDPRTAQKLLFIEPKKIVQFIPADGMEQEFIGAVKQIKKIFLELIVDQLLLLSKHRELSSTEKLQLQQILQERTI